MAEQLPGGIQIRTEDDRVEIEVAGGLWEGDAGQAERVLTGLHYALARARPGTNIGSMFLNGSLWGGKFVERDTREAVRHMRHLIAQLGELIDKIEERETHAGEPQADPGSPET